METKEIFELLPNDIKNEILKRNCNDSLQEIRLKINKPLFLMCNGSEIRTSLICTIEHIKYLMQRISNYSLYAFEQEIRQGFITIKGGHRVGLCGNCTVENECVKTIRNISSVNIRIAREFIGCGEKLIPYITEEGNILNTILISPPKCGKTTLLRDISRIISQGDSKYGVKGKNLSIIDERSEIAACYKGIPQMNVGERTDVLDQCPKSSGIIMAIRSMSPEVVVCDEIGTLKDMESIVLALNSGVSVITSIHGYSIEDLFERKVFSQVLENKVFKRAIVLSARNGTGTVEYIYDFTKDGKIRR